MRIQWRREGVGDGGGDLSLGFRFNSRGELVVHVESIRCQNFLLLAKFLPAFPPIVRSASASRQQSSRTIDSCG
ncbi:hypothetical protein M758_5G048000, partial [Ceratodon purpureus]